MKVHKLDNSIELSLNFASNEDNWDSEDIYNYFSKDKVEFVSVLAHEIKHKFDKQKKETDLIGKDADYQAYTSSGLNFGIPVISEFMRHSYFIQHVENLVRPTEMATRMKLTGITKEKFREFFENDKVIKELKEIKNFSYEYLIEKLHEQMDKIDGLLEHVEVPYEDMSEDKKIYVLMELVYINLIRAKKDIFDKMTEDMNDMAANFMRMMGMGHMVKDEGLEKVRHKFLSHLARYQNKEKQFFVDECERFNYVSTKLIKRLSKIYSLIPDEKEQTNESILNWDLHQKLMEKRYGKRPIETSYKYKK